LPDFWLKTALKPPCVVENLHQRQLEEDHMPTKTTIAALALIATVTAAEAQTRYTVYCANSRIEVDMRDNQQMRSARGSGICSFGSFSLLGDAHRHSRQFGGVGGKCSCG
jgi:hypothetical protein